MKERPKLLREGMTHQQKMAVLRKHRPKDWTGKPQSKKKTRQPKTSQVGFAKSPVQIKHAVRTDFGPTEKVIIEDV